MTDEIVDGELVTPNTTTALAPAALFGTDDPIKVLDRAVAIAQPLAKLIDDRRLFMQIRDRKHVYVEGWTLLGAMLGCSPILQWSRKVTDEEGRWNPPVTHVEFEERTRSDGSTYKAKQLVVDTPGRGGWEARVEMVRHGDVISAGEMECRWEEEGWRTRDSYAVRSMAQTRATSKAGRLALSFVMSLAGFDVTPAEEFSGDRGDDLPSEDTDPNVYMPHAYCPSCRGTKIIDRSDDPNRGAKPTYACANPKCTGGGEKRDGSGRWPWATYRREDLHFAVKVTKIEEPDQGEPAATEQPTTSEAEAQADPEWCFAQAALLADKGPTGTNKAAISGHTLRLYQLMIGAKLWPSDAWDKAFAKRPTSNKAEDVLAWAEQSYKYARTTLAAALKEEIEHGPTQLKLEAIEEGKPFDGPEGA